MQKGFRIAALAGALSMAMGGTASAANHDLEFGGWSVTGGQIDHNSAAVCQSTNYDCNVVAAGNGFKQIQVSPSATNTTTPSTDSYIMTVVTDQDASGAYGAGDLGFYDVSFVKMQMSLGGTGSTQNENGIFAEQKIEEVTTVGAAAATQFNSTTNISTGWATAAASPVSISQSLIDNGDTATAGDDFSSTFMYGSDNDAAGTRTGFEMSIDQKAGLASANQPSSANDVQVFALRERQGTKLAASGSVALSGTSSMSWAAGDDIKAIWLGQTINLDDQAAIAGGLGSTFGYLSFDNVSGDTAAPISEFGFATSNADQAWVWDPAFNIGTSGTPCLSDPSGVNCP